VRIRLQGDQYAGVSASGGVWYKLCKDAHGKLRVVERATEVKRLLEDVGMIGVVDVPSRCTVSFTLVFSSKLFEKASLGLYRCCMTSYLRRWNHVRHRFQGDIRARYRQETSTGRVIERFHCVVLELLIHCFEV
jgi:hypothetical protein